MVVKTFRGLLVDGGQDRIRLSTIKGKMGYRIITLQVIPEDVGTTASESLVQLWMTKQTTVPTAAATVNFSNSDLLAVGYVTHDDNQAYGISSKTIIFDSQMFNQDIYVTHTENRGALNCNYYLELEVIPLDDKMAEYSTIKDLRSNA